MQTASITKDSAGQAIKIYFWTMIRESVNHINIIRVKGDGHATAEDTLAIEEPLEIQLAYFNKEGQAVQRSISVTMRTPGQDAALGIGFLFTEGIIRSREQVKEVLIPGANKIQVQLVPGVQPVLQQAERNFYTTSSCGVCGKSSIDAIRTVSPFGRPAAIIQLPPELLYALPQKLREQQEIFESTGGLHASALFTFMGDLLTLQEDVGRHNALDNVVDTAFMQDQLPLDKMILLLSGRASFELVQKAAMAGIPVIAAVGAPSSLAVALAAEQGITLIGFLREERFNIYSCPERITGTTT